MKSDLAGGSVSVKNDSKTVKQAPSRKEETHPSSVTTTAAATFTTLGSGKAEKSKEKPKSENAETPTADSEKTILVTNTSKLKENGSKSERAPLAQKSDSIDIELIKYKGKPQRDTSSPKSKSNAADSIEVELITRKPISKDITLITTEPDVIDLNKDRSYNRNSKEQGDGTLTLKTTEPDVIDLNENRDYDYGLDEAGGEGAPASNNNESAVGTPNYATKNAVGLPQLID